LYPVVSKTLKASSMEMTMLNIPGTYEGMSYDEYVDILEQYVIYLEDLLSPVAGMLKVIMPLDVELEDDEEVH